MEEVVKRLQSCQMLLSGIAAGREDAHQSVVVVCRNDVLHIALHHGVASQCHVVVAGAEECVKREGLVECGIVIISVILFYRELVGQRGHALQARTVGQRPES